MADSRRRIAAIIAITVVFGLSSATQAQETPKPDEVGCTTVNGVATGPGCDAGAGGTPAAKVENGMPATEHQQDVLRTDDKASQGQNMEATGAGGGSLPQTEHQADVLKQPDPASDKTTSP